LLQFGQSATFNAGLAPTANAWKDRTVTMDARVNQETVNDTAKLIMHRLIARKLAHDPSLIERARAAQAKVAVRFTDRPFVAEWDELLMLPITTLRHKLVSRDSDMVRLRISSPFVLAEEVDFTDYEFRLRIRRAARRVAERGLARRTQAPELAV
jgi:hypothetical protein